MMASVELNTNGGDRYTSTVDHPLGRPENPLSDREIYEEFTACTVRNTDKEMADRIYDKFRALSEQDDICDLVALL